MFSIKIQWEKKNDFKWTTIQIESILQHLDIIIFFSRSNQPKGKPFTKKKSQSLHQRKSTVLSFSHNQICAKKYPTEREKKYITTGSDGEIFFSKKSKSFEIGARIKIQLCICNIFSFNLFFTRNWISQREWMKTKYFFCRLTYGWREQKKNIQIWYAHSE